MDFVSATKSVKDYDSNSGLWSCCFPKSVAKYSMLVSKQGLENFQEKNMSILSLTWNECDISWITVSSNVNNMHLDSS